MAASSTSVAIGNHSSSPALRWMVLGGRVFLAVIFLFAAWTKMPWRQPAALFAMTIDSYRLLPFWGVNLVAQTLPWVELAIGLLLLSGRGLRTVTTIASLLLLGFFTLMVRTYALGLEINCGCFGPGERLGPLSLVRDGTLLAVSLAVTVGAFLLHRRRSQRPV
jgi:putative oxidoreductase